MCGIAGIIGSVLSEQKESILRDMTNQLTHRGPNANGIFMHDAVALTHTRLAIRDLSDAGLQPMRSFDQEWMIVFNGEIYNYKVIKRQLVQEFKIDFIGETDTEVLINAIAKWGIDKTLRECMGMFAFAAYHIPAKKTYLVRDRFGEKPLYFGTQNRIVGFASELKALYPLKKLGWKFEVNRNALSSYMRFGYVPAPHCIYHGLHKLNPGCFAVIDSNLMIEMCVYWDAKKVLHVPKFSGSYLEAVDVLEEKLKNTVRNQMVSDVPIGAFLSGGIDSSTIVALMQSLSAQKINTFSIGFEDKKYNEAPFAAAVANHLHVNHNELYIGKSDVLNVISRLPYIYDEPFGDASQIPTVLVSQLARSKITVALSGDGGDELFCGYNRYILADQLRRRILSNFIIRSSVLYAPTRLFKFFGRTSKKFSILFDKLMKLQQVIKYSQYSEIEIYRNLCSQLYQPNSLVLGGLEYAMYEEKNLINTNLLFEEWMMFVDSQTYLQDDILTKVDRAAMSVSLETRVPFLDHSLYEFAWSLPLEFKLNNGVGKKILRDVLYRYVPEKLLNRPKMGFGVPLDNWLRFELREWAGTLLDEGVIREQGFLNSEHVKMYWNEHLSGKRNWQGILWNILMFQSWYECSK